MILKVVLVGVLGPLFLFIFFVLQRKQKYPEKSLFNSFLNIALTPLRALKYGPFKQGKISLEKAMKYAVKKTKLTDFGDMTFADSYNTIDNTATHKSLILTNLGYIMARLELNNSMVRRLQLIQYLKDVPEVTKIPVPSPVFVLGLPRTGTTFLHRLLSLDPQVRAPLLWELLAPIPKPLAGASQEVMDKDREKRAKFIRKLIKSRRDVGDHALEHIHEIGADLPEECIMGLSDEIPTHLSYFYSCYLNIKLFFEVIDFHKVVRAYEYYKSILQLLSYQVGDTQNPKRWTLKCPIHLFYPREIAAAFPGAKLIWTHRHPISAVPSLCSLLKAIHQVYYENECRDDALLGRRITDLSADLLERAPKEIAESGLDCSHIVYNDLIRDPMAVLKSIYRQFGWTFSPEYEAIVVQFLAEDRAKREGIKLKKQAGGKAADAGMHHYTPEEFSVTAAELSAGKFADYVAAFKVPMSKD